MSEAKMSELVKKRAVTKGRLTLFENYVKRCKCPLDDQQILELQLRVDKSSSLFDNYTELQSLIEESTDELDLPKQLEDRDRFEDQYYRTVASAKLLLQKEVPANNNVVMKSKVCVKLPDIKIPTFDGSYDSWLEFKNSYCTMIHEREDLDSIQKFHYLRSSLTNSASQVIGALEFTADNYSHAWELLENRYNNLRLLQHNHVKSLYAIPSLHKESASQLRKLIDTVLRNLRALSSLGEQTHAWDTLIIYLVVSKLDPSTEREWEQYQGTLYNANTKPPFVKLDDLLKFLKDRADMLDIIKVNHSKHSHDNKSSDQTQNKKQSTHSYVATNAGDKINNKNKTSKTNKRGPRVCVMCKGNHSLYTCSKFINLPVQDRINLVNTTNTCKNCLRSGHAVQECTFGPCRLCHLEKHNSLIHVDSADNGNVVGVNNTQSQPITTNVSNINNVSTSLHSSANSTDSLCEQTYSVLPTVLLSTALVDIADNNNDYHTARVLLDNGSQQCFIRKSLCDKLNASLIQSTCQVTGVGHSIATSAHTCKILLRSKDKRYHTNIECLVLPCITNRLPAFSINVNNISIPDNIQLADPTFHSPSDIDILIGADKFWDLLIDGKIRLKNGPYLQNSKLGWIMSGPLYNNNNGLRINQVQCNYSQTLDTQLKQFWELEEIPNTGNILSADEQKCENIFVETTTRTHEGKFSVCIPFKESPAVLGESYNAAEKRLLSLERKFTRFPEFREKYINFMSEYESLGHMSRVDTYGSPHYFLPHHGVINENSSTTKLRTVFDASAVTSTGKSLNSIQLIGPPLQNDIFSILLRFRQYQYVACADVEKMYRQILVQPDQRDLQLILWRKNPSDSIGIYRLNTVTYGTASAPYLSMRCLNQLARECEDEQVATVIRDDFYVDDVLIGSDDLNSLFDMCDKVTNTLKSACLPLRKWIFNLDITAHDISKRLALGDQCQNKTLGMGWFNKKDELHFTSRVNNNNTYPLTKRSMLSLIAQVYDPLGMLAPAIIIAKIVMQKLWLCKINWDDPVPNDVVLSWDKFISTLQCLRTLRIPRCVISSHSQYIELHIFSDASQCAYGACTYVRTYSDNSAVTCQLLCAKSKVAPLKPTSIPRLELCGALIGARLYRKIINSLRLTFHKTFFWTDSTIVLGWLRMSPHLLKTFVQNRVVEINELTSNAIWSHVSTKNNPADLVSRGVSLDTLSECSLWWNGPPFLQCHELMESQHCTVSRSDYSADLPELKPHTTAMVCDVVTQNTAINFERFSSYNRIRRTCAYVLRFIHNSRTQRQERIIGPLSVNELRSSTQLLTRLAQRESFPSEYTKLKGSLSLQTTSAISSLNIFLDNHDIIRVGGRLTNSPNFGYDKKHPSLLCCKHRFTLLLFQHFHDKLLHAGPQLLLATVRESWWPLGGRNLARKVVHQCVRCTRLRGKTVSPIMGNLPAERLEPGFPFIRCGVDYAGPISVLNRKGRGAKLEKGYICLFVCFITRAIHLELVSTLSAQEYLLALKRFISRRGKPAQIFSDNGTNFIGAMKVVKLMFNEHSRQIIDTLSNDDIEFKFIPPYAPHFGGLWEAGVKSCKHHLRRVMGTANLTYEEFSTVLAQIEAVLNSRPMFPMSSDPHDLLPLSPAHFLIGRPLLSPACKDLTEQPINRLTRFQRVEQMRQQFWKRWSTDYISELQTRTKWKTHTQNLALNTLAVIKEDNLPPLKWRMGRIVKVFTGTDGVSRVAELQTATGPLQRAFSKICPLPVPSTTSGGQDNGGVEAAGDAAI